jgi:hypothetical protein
MCIITQKHFNRCKSSCNDEITAKLFKTGGESLRSEIFKVNNYIWNEEELPWQWKKFNSATIYKKGKKLTVIIVEACHCY